MLTRANTASERENNLGKKTKERCQTAPVSRLSPPWPPNHKPGAHRAHALTRHPRAGGPLRRLSEAPGNQPGSAARSASARVCKTGNLSTKGAWQVRQFASELESLPGKQKAPPPPGSPQARGVRGPGVRGPGCCGREAGVCAGAVHTRGRSRARSFRWWGDRPALVSAGTRHARACGTAGP